MNKHTRKPLELMVYPKLDRPRRGDQIMAYRSQFIDEQLIIQAKRFSDAELAAETYKAEAEFRAAAGYGYSAEIVRECDRKRSILERFATLSAYDEAAL